MIRVTSPPILEQRGHKAENRRRSHQTEVTRDDLVVPDIGVVVIDAGAPGDDAIGAAVNRLDRHPGYRRAKVHRLGAHVHQERI